MQTNDKGNVSESKVLAAYIEAGFIVSVPFGNGAPYDFIVDTGARLLKVQVKTGRLRDGCILFPMQRHCGRTGKGKQYNKEEIDLFAIYCPDTESIYLMPLSNNATVGRLRLIRTKNNQQQRIRWAKNFELGACLKELREGVELVGIEPTTS